MKHKNLLTTLLSILMIFVITFSSAVSEAADNPWKNNSNWEYNSNSKVPAKNPWVIAKKTTRTITSSSTAANPYKIPYMQTGKNKVNIAKNGAYIGFGATKNKKYRFTFTDLENTKNMDFEYYILPANKGPADIDTLKVSNGFALCNNKYAKEYRYTGYVVTRNFSVKLKKGEVIYFVSHYSKKMNKKAKISYSVKIK